MPSIFIASPLLYTNTADAVPTTSPSAAGARKPRLLTRSAAAKANTRLSTARRRTFHCTLCPQSFYRSDHLSRHHRIHTGERPFECIFCQKRFSRHDELKRHSKMHACGDLMLLAETALMYEEGEFDYSMTRSATPSF
mgnify:CR=1 FL=1